MQPAQKRFLARFVVALGAFYLLVAIQPVNDRVVVPFTELLVRVSTALLAVLGERTVSFGTVIQSPAFAVDVKNGCNGIEAALLLVAAMLAFPASPKRRAQGIAAGLAVIQGVNLLRIVSLFWLGVHHRVAFELFHAAVWQTALILLAVGIFLAWSRRANVGGPSEARA
ncbi:MAG TPA: exosortase H [Thermoanaerobaculia bacterium]|nr:exosortase H [Thermoanaerobaculia bacterium]